MKKTGKKSGLKSLLPRRKNERRSTELWSALAVGTLVVSIFIASSLDRYLIGTQQYAAVIAAVLVDLANGDRAAQNLGTLTVNPVLVAAAQAKADDMATYSYFAHVSPQGVDPWHWFQIAGYKFDYAGENLAVDFNDSSDVNAAWMNSQTHRENILGAHYTEIGIAVSQGMYQGRPTTFVVQEFGTPSSRAGAIVSQTVPENPSTPALASAATSAVLGEAAQPAQKPVAKPKPAATAQKPTDILGSNIAANASAPPVRVTTASAPDYAPWWQHLIASPKEMLHNAYYFIAFLVIAGLLITTEFELRYHHRKKAAAAGFVLALISILFIFGDSFVFTSPILPQEATQTAASAAF